MKLGILGQFGRRRMAMYFYLLHFAMQA